ncbi:MAG: DUF4293 domain-containing protein [Candidatus Cardinium sp.]|nr:DUF4293 domain-containing protein [Candidatus Cardinium sp.]
MSTICLWSTIEIITMLQRIQSVYLGIIGIAMLFFLRLVRPIIGEVSGGNVCHAGKLLYSLSIAAVCLACFTIILTAYAIKRHDNRQLQFRLVCGLLLMLFLLTLLNVLCIYIQPASKWTHSLLCLISVGVFPLLAMYRIRKDDRLVRDDHLR